MNNTELREREVDGITERSKTQFSEYKNDLGVIHTVEIEWDKDTLDYHTIIQAENDRLHFSGFSIGYSGEGPEGLIWLLDECKMQYDRDDIVNPVEDSGKRMWTPTGRAV